ncbi:carotenoid 9,10(9',10')-cleavage dioxygenase 1-like [Mercurialis annua]|uniref:carotenoid 9,10(9',10')-cleavage dioxygenase 1-like n=1 Tax=Mercurialis annua TaxID=3986 RepID=UPI0021604935|nr:carotenoid 9,10(9',10')-cleavage dioxygenase 1-like [Mercurialis annua]
MASSVNWGFQANCSLQKSSFSDKLNNLKSKLFSTLKPFSRELESSFLLQTTVKNTSFKLLDAFVDSVFEFVEQPLLPSQSNFAPVDELKKAVTVTAIEGEIPHSFSQGVYIRNGANPLFGGLKSTNSVFGRSSNIWVEGEGMVHALYFDKGSDGRWTVLYNNRYIETETFKLENERNRPCFLPATEGNPAAVLAAFFFNQLRFGKVNKYFSNTNVFEHAGRYFSVAENHIPQEIDIFTLQTLDNWDVNGTWNRPFTSHAKRAPDSGELVIMGIDATKPFMELGVISADGKRLVHKVDLKLDRCTLSHDIGVTQRYNVILDFPLTIDIHRLIKGGPLIQYNKEDYSKIGVMPRYGDANSIKWFEVQPACTFHIFNCFEHGDEVVVWGCKALNSVIPGPEMGLNKNEWFSRRFRAIQSSLSSEANSNGTNEDESLFSRCHEWRLNMETGEVKERYLSGTQFSMDFPIINSDYAGLKTKYGYTQMLDSEASSVSGMAKYGGLAKLYFEEPHKKSSLIENQFDEVIRVEYHKFEKNTFCTGVAFVPKIHSLEEDDGWLIAFVHNEDTNVSKAYIVDSNNFSGEAIAKITLPCRVPYGFHGVFMPIQLPNLI